MNISIADLAIKKAAETDSKTLTLAGEGIGTVPRQIGELKNLESLTLKGNGLSDLPDEISELKNLRRLSLAKNNFEAIPDSICELFRLEELFLSRNQIETLPPGIGKLRNLRTLSLHRNKLSSLPPEIGDLRELRALMLQSNRLTSLPSEIVKLTQLKTIELGKNPLSAQLNVVAKNGVYALMSYMLGLQFGDEMPDFITHRILVKDELRTSLHQYLVFFVDFVKVSKDKEVDFQVSSIPGGLELRVRSEGPEQAEKVVTYLQEYVSLIGQNLDSLLFSVESAIDPTERGILVVELRNQLRMLQSSVEIRNVKIEYLQSEVRYLREAFRVALSRPAPILINVSSTSNAEAEATSHVSVNVAISELQETFALLVEAIESSSPEISRELKPLAAELESLEEEAQDPGELDKPLLDKVRQVIVDIQNPDSRLGKVVRQIGSTARVAQRVAKAYNSIAQWVGLPQVPNVLVDLGN